VNPAPDTRPPLDAARLRDLPAPLTVDLRESVPSTNALLADLAREGAAEGLVVVAEHQTAGRGRVGRSWETPPRAALTFSVLLRPSPGAEGWTLLPLLAGLAVVAGVGASGGPPLALKWPNDVLAHDGMKVAGVLLERVDTGDGPAAVVGVGLNVSTTRAELPQREAGSLLTAGMLDPDRTQLLRQVLIALLDRYRVWGTGPEGHRTLLRAYADLCDTLGRTVRVHLPGGRERVGRAVGVGPEGALLLSDGSGTQAVAAGDVVHVRVP
jgi:BirA family transcriptional regulator, biotin operon repressor / biotin---[acetyl-CoA-carboxylase] ligase